MADREGITGALTYDPGADAARRHPGWVIRHRNLLGVPEVMCPKRQVILIEHTADRGERRCNLAHAVAHIDLGHEASPNGHISHRQEVAADRLAARRLIDVRHLADTIMWADSFEEMCSELDVDRRMLFVRMKYLHPAERGLVVGHIDEKLLSA